MKNLKRFVAVFIALALSAVMLISCGNEGNEAIAVYDGDKYIYQNDDDFSDFYNLNRYFFAYEKGDEAESSTEYNTILSKAIKETITVRVMEEKIKKEGNSLDYDKIFSEAEKDENTFEDFYHGGFEKFCEDWGLSKNVFVFFNTYEAIKEYEMQFMEVEISDEEARKYYNRNTDKYFKIPHYDVSTIFLQVINPSDKDHKHKVYDDALIYIQMLNSGRTWESVKNTATLHYNEDNGMVFSEYLTRLNHVSMEYFYEVKNLEESLADIDSNFFLKHGKMFEEMFPDGFEAYAKVNRLVPETKEYNQIFEIYMNYAETVYKTEFNYAITNFWKTGETYAKPIYHYGFNSYVLLTFTGIEEEHITIKFDEAKEDIIKILEEEKKDEAVENYFSHMIDDLKIRIFYK